MSIDKTPWYRQPWPWILMSGPAAVVVAGTWTAFIAARSSDGLVTEDYYRQGMTINRVLARQRHASELGIGARLVFEGARTVRVILAGSPPPSANLRLSMTHPADASQDESIVLVPAAQDEYLGALRAAPRGVSRIVLEDGEGRWRLDGAMRDAASVTLGASAGPRP
jgi:hypothetical protein